MDELYSNSGKQVLELCYIPVTIFKGNPYTFHPPQNDIAGMTSNRISAYLVGEYRLLSVDKFHLLDRIISEIAPTYSQAE
jgi:hypothetical protein